MILQVIWNDQLKKMSLYVSETDDNKDYEIIHRLPLKNRVSTQFVQNFIALPEFKLSYTKDKKDNFFWLDNVSLLKNILAFFNLIDLVHMQQKDLFSIDTFAIEKNIPINDRKNLGFQSPIKTIPRNLFSQPQFLSRFLYIADASFRLLRTTYNFENNTFLFTVNKRNVPINQFFNHLNCNRDRIRIKESLVLSNNYIDEIVNYFTDLSFYQEIDVENKIYHNNDYGQFDHDSESNDNIHNTEVVRLNDNNDIKKDIIIEEISQKNSLDLNNTHSLSVDNVIDNFSNNSIDNLVDNSVEVFAPTIEKISLEKQDIIDIVSIKFINKLNIVPDKRAETLENFYDDDNVTHKENFHDYFANERNLEDFLLPNKNLFEHYDHSVYADNHLLDNKIEKSLDDIIIEEELTEEFLVDIESPFTVENTTFESHFNSEDSISVEDLVDSINDIIDDTFIEDIDEQLSLEMIDIIDLPIILFLDNVIDKIIVPEPAINESIIHESLNLQENNLIEHVQSNNIEVTKQHIQLDDDSIINSSTSYIEKITKKQEQANTDEFINDIFIDSDVNNELNNFSAEDVLEVVKKEVSIFENTVGDKKKYKSIKNKHKKNKDNHHINNNTQNDKTYNDKKLSIPFLDRDIDDNLLDENHSSDNVIKDIIIEDITSLDNNNIDNLPIYVSDDHKKEDRQLLVRLEIENLPIEPFILSAYIQHNLLIHSQESIIIIEFLLQVNLIEDTIDNTILIENSDALVQDNFDFFEEQQRKLIDLCMIGDIEAIEQLYLNYPDFEKPLINFNYEGDNPVCIAAFNENLDLLKKLINYGWNPNYFDANLNNALIIAAAEGHKHIVKFLLTQPLQFNFQNKKGYTALHFAVNDCNHRIVKLLLDAGVDVELSDNDRNTPLSIAAFKGDINSTKLLLQTRINIHTKNKKGYDARSIALLAKNHAVAKLIEDKIISDKHNYSLPPIIEKNTSYK